MLEDESDTVIVIEVVLLLAIFACCLIGNSMMCLVVYKHRGRRSRTYTLLGNLAIADLGLGLFCMPFTIATLISKRWVLGPLLCNANGFMNAFWIPATVFSTTSITIHKYHSLHEPFNPNRAWNRVRVFISLTWLLSFVCGIGPLLGWHKFSYDPMSSQCGLSRAETTLDYSYLVFLAITVYSIPTIINGVSFILLFRTIQRHVARLGQNAIVSQSRTSAQKRTACTFLMIFLSYFICWTPFFIYGLLTLASGKDGLAGQYLTAAYILGFSNSVHNPIIFAFRNKNFRDRFKEIAMALCGRCKGRFRTLTTNTIASNFTSGIFQRSNSGLGSAWYVNSSEVERDDVGFENLSLRLNDDSNDVVILNEMRKHHDNFNSTRNYHA